MAELVTVTLAIFFIGCGIWMVAEWLKMWFDWLEKKRRDQ